MNRAETLWRGGTGARNKLRTPGGVGCVANKGLTKRGFWKCGKQRTYGRIFGSVANKGLSSVLAGGRELRGRDETYRAAEEHQPRTLLQNDVRSQGICEYFLSA